MSPQEEPRFPVGRLLVVLVCFVAGLSALVGAALWIASLSTESAPLADPGQPPQFALAPESEPAKPQNLGESKTEPALKTKAPPIVVDRPLLIDPNPAPMTGEGKKSEQAKAHETPKRTSPEKQERSLPPAKEPEPAKKTAPPKTGLITPFILDEKEIAKRVVGAGGKLGNLTISLAWQNYNDLDLHVLTAQGDRIFYLQRFSRCGGQLDIDQNVLPTTTTPVENIYWQGKLPSGTLKVFVHLYKNHRLPGCADPSRFSVRLQLGDKVRVYEGAVSGNNMVFVTELNPQAPKNFVQELTNKKAP